MDRLLFLFRWRFWKITERELVREATTPQNDIKYVVYLYQIVNTIITICYLLTFDQERTYAKKRADKFLFWVEGVSA